MVATGENIKRLRIRNTLFVRDVQRWFNFEEPRIIYKWQSGQTLPSVDNLFALSALLGVTMDEIIVRRPQPLLVHEPDHAGSVILFFFKGLGVFKSALPRWNHGFMARLGKEW